MPKPSRYIQIDSPSFTYGDDNYWVDLLFTAN